MHSGIIDFPRFCTALIVEVLSFSLQQADHLRAYWRSWAIARDKGKEKREVIELLNLMLHKEDGAGLQTGLYSSKVKFPVQSVLYHSKFGSRNVWESLWNGQNIWKFVTNVWATTRCKDIFNHVFLLWKWKEVLLFYIVPRYSQD